MELTQLERKDSFITLCVFLLPTLNTLVMAQEPPKLVKQKLESLASVASWNHDETLM
jgi:hypothetical protein